MVEITRYTVAWCMIHATILESILPILYRAPLWGSWAVVTHMSFGRNVLFLQTLWFVRDSFICLDVLR